MLITQLLNNKTGDGLGGVYLGITGHDIFTLGQTIESALGDVW